MPFPAFNGLRRKAVVLGVPVVALVSMLIGVAVIALLAGLVWWVLALVLWPVMAVITKNDDNAFRTLGLWVMTKVRNCRSVRFWGGSSYSMRDYRGDKWL